MNSFVDEFSNHFFRLTLALTFRWSIFFRILLTKYN